MKKCIALSLCLSLVVINFNTSSAKAETLSNETKNYQTIFGEEIKNSPEVEIIDALANEYYNYYIENGVTQQTILDLLKHTENDDILSQTKLIYPLETNAMLSENLISTSVATTDYSMIIRQATGYIYSLESIAMQLASVGILMQLSYAMPFLEFAAILVGAVIITLVVAIAYTMVAVSVNEYILALYASRAAEISIARANTVVLVEQQKNGAKYWRCTKASWGGMGGILIHEPLKMSEAQGIVEYNNEYLGVFAFYRSDAETLAKSVLSYKVSPVEVHRNNGQSLNVQHVHAYIGNLHASAHIWFAIPVIY